MKQHVIVIDKSIAGITVAGANLAIGDMTYTRLSSGKPFNDNNAILLLPIPLIGKTQNTTGFNPVYTYNVSFFSINSHQKSVCIKRVETRLTKSFAVLYLRSNQHVNDELIVTTEHDYCTAAFWNEPDCRHFFLTDANNQNTLRHTTHSEIKVA